MILFFILFLFFAVLGAAVVDVVLDAVIVNFAVVVLVIADIKNVAIL